MKLHMRNVTRAFATMAVASFVLAGCSGGGNGSDAPDPDMTTEGGGENGSGDEGLAGISSLGDGFIRTDEGGDPVDGGTFRWAAYAEPGSLDPAETIYAGTTGGIEMLNIYDTIVRWDT